MTSQDAPGYTRLDICRRFVASVKHSTLLEMEVLAADQESVRVRMPYQEALVGNPETGVTHGGAIFALMDQAGGLANACRIFPDFEITPTIDMRVDHLRAPRPQHGVVCEAHCYRLSQHVAFVRMSVFEEGTNSEPASSELLATGLATYMRMKFPGADRVVS